MNCPHCPAVRLAMADRHGIEIDYCPQCRGGLRELFDFD
ncbi:MAG TPA: zf-TFIIB domain-containing protein [Burkholderiales bacterium]